MISKGAGLTKPVIRGLSNSNILVLNDGVKLENFQFSENHPYLFDESDAGQIEVIKGPASLLYGSDAVGGLINILSEPPAPYGKTTINLRQEYHSATQGINTNLSLKGTEDKIYLDRPAEASNRIKTMKVEQAPPYLTAASTAMDSQPQQG
ncbi:MAG: TonB-dependent receptor plug domain-containing protein [Bacteroidales bacterium]|nr:TonB-dependent receptor plug domain-containing protein [Bacteroidales bacterium]